MTGHEQGALQIAPGRSRRRRGLALAVAVAAGACLALGLYEAGAPVVAAVSIAIGLSVLGERLDHRLHGQHLLLQLTPSGAWYVWQHGWQMASTWSANVSASGILLRMRVDGVTRRVSIWRDTVPAPVWQGLARLAVRQQVLSPDRQAGGAA